jgi:hypothetical protein
MEQVADERAPADDNTEVSGPVGYSVARVAGPHIGDTSPDHSVARVGTVQTPGFPRPGRALWSTTRWLVETGLLAPPLKDRLCTHGV